MVKTPPYQKWGKCGHFMPKFDGHLAFAVELSARGKTRVHRELIPHSVLFVQHLQRSSGLISERTLQRDPHTDINLARRVTLLKSRKQMNQY